MSRCLPPARRSTPKGSHRFLHPDGGARRRLLAVAVAALLVVTASPALAAEDAPGPSTTEAVPDRASTSTTSTPSVDEPQPTATVAPGTSTSTTTTTSASPSTAPPTTATEPAEVDPFVQGPAPGDGAPGAGRLPEGEGSSGTASSEPSATGHLTGPDVSSWQHPNGVPIDWSQVTAAGHSFAFVKATEGPSALGRAFYENPWYDADFGGAGAVGLYRAPYHFARPMLPLSSAIEQARFMVAVTGRLGGPRDLPHVLDIEVTGGLGAHDLTEWTVAFVEETERLTGRKPIIYTGPYFWRTYLADTDRLSGYPLWMASWTNASTPGSLFGGWSSWEFWQYTDSGSSPGIPGAIDLNRSCCGIGGLAKLTNRPIRSYQRLSNTTGIAESTQDFHVPPWGQSLVCDFDGNGVDTMALFDRGSWYTTDAAGAGPPQHIFGYGQSGDRPVCGDWDGNGTETPGIVRDGNWYLTNVTGRPVADYSFGFGNPGDLPVVGDWNGDGIENPGMFRQGVWFLSNAIGHGIADSVIGYGNAADLPMAGDWDNNGTDTPGIFRDGNWYLVDSLGKGIADRLFGFGSPSDTPTPGRWRAGLPTTPGIARPI